jgi:hypothetical protein
MSNNNVVDYKELLIQEVQKYWGSTIKVASDCEALALQIAKTTNIIISGQTLRRIYGNVYYQSKPSFFTLDTLSKYIGYKSYHEFITKYNEKTTTEPTYDFGLIEKLFVNNTQNESDYKLWHEGLCSILIQTIFSNKNVLEQFTKALNKNTGAMVFVWASYQFYDMVNTDWFMRSFRIFCSNSKIIHHQLYYANIQYMAYLLSNQGAKGTNDIITMNTLLPKVQQKYGCVFPLEGAVYGCLIANAYLNKNEVEVDKIFNEAIATVKQNINNTFYEKNTLTYHYFIHSLIEVLMCIGMYDKVSYLIDLFEYKATSETMWIISQKEIVNINTAIIMLHNKNVKKAQNLFNSIKIDNIRFDRKTMNTINYLLLKLGLTSKTANKTRVKIIEEINKLCNQSSMLCFKTLIGKF